MVNKGKEAEIVKGIKNTLGLFIREVIHVDRLQSGVVRHGERFIHLCKPGTPDLYAILSSKGGHVVFIECKAPGGYQSVEQKMFQRKIAGLNNVHYVLAKSLDDVIAYIKLHITEA